VCVFSSVRKVARFQVWRRTWAAGMGRDGRPQQSRPAGKKRKMEQAMPFRPILCGWRGCKKGADVRNAHANLALPRQRVWEIECRPMRKHAAVVRFCCQKHMQKCEKPHTKPVPRGQREGMTADQFSHAFAVAKENGLAWLAVLMLLQVLAGDRASCMCAARRSWLQDLSGEFGRPPLLSIPANVNGKSKKRDVPLPMHLAQAFASWLGGEPLGNSWPFKGQPDTKTAYLFPGRPGSSNTTAASKSTTAKCASLPRDFARGGWCSGLRLQACVSLATGSRTNGRRRNRCRGGGTWTLFSVWLATWAESVQFVSPQAGTTRSTGSIWRGWGRTASNGRRLAS
jgi:hypothetical protein